MIVGDARATTSNFLRVVPNGSIFRCLKVDPFNASGIPLYATIPLKHGKAASGRLALAPSDLVEYTSLNSLTPIANWLV